MRVLRSGEHIAEGSFVADSDEVMIGEPGAERRILETGRTLTTPHRVVMDIPGIETIVGEARRVFDPILPELEARYARGPKQQHRLPQLLAVTEDNLISLRAGAIEVDILSVLELNRATTSFKRWGLDPAFERLLQESKEPSAFPHNVLLLTVASALDHAGLGPELVAPADSRTPDLRLRVSARRSIEADVKTPATLQRRPGEAVPVKGAEKVVGSAIHDSRGQFIGPSLLILGGAFWASDFDRHATATERAITKPLPPEASQEAHEHRRGLLGVVLASTTIQFARARGSGRLEGKWHEVDWMPASAFRWVPNPGYALDLQLTLAPDLSTFEISFRP